LVNAVGIPLQIDLLTLFHRAILSSLQNVKKSSRVDFISDITLSNPRLLWHSLLELISIDLRPELATITIPTLIIWGERDLLVPLPLGQALFRALPHAYFVSLPNCAHRPHFTEPEKFSRLVVEFSNR
ncbi:MAG TPA: alpha/beta hydrolase, partial [Methylomirabilota bacterium]|nr:alpha/beta hydrolase [Methylomirabilota bacterium]